MCVELNEVRSWEGVSFYFIDRAANAVIVEVRSGFGPCCYGILRCVTFVGVVIAAANRAGIADCGL